MEKKSNCPCGSEKPYANCCSPFHEGKNPETTELLLRARYSAFAMGKIDYILATHHSETVKDVKRDEIEEWSKESEWQALEIEAMDRGTASDDEGVIVFHAKYRAQGKDHDHHEKSFFKKEKGLWKFYDAHGIQTGPYQREEPKTGRNDPCPCGSGKKFKKCHAA